MTLSLSQLADPHFFAENRLEPHSDHRWYATEEEAAAGDSSFEQLLSGEWRFHCAKNPDAVPGGFEAPDFDVTDWDEIAVPGHIQLQGYDRPQYVNKQYPWDGRVQVAPPNIPTAENPVGCYVKDFSVATPMVEGERLTLQFDGAEAAVAVWVNGHYVGYAEDSFTPSTFDITDYVTSGENRLAAQVYKWTSASWLEDQDFFRFSGLFRDVWLKTRPSTHIEDVRVRTLVTHDRERASVTVDLKMAGRPGQVQGALFDESGAKVGDFAQPEAGTLELEVAHPHLWSSERPYLYSALLEVFDAEGTLTEVVPLKVGIRRFGIEDGVLKINGERLMFRGVNRHEFGRNGRVVTREETRRDLVLLKRLGVNAIRTAHYPNSRDLYELADELGFYVLDEMNLETHGSWDQERLGDVNLETVLPGDDPKWVPMLEDRANNMLQGNKNHPSIVMWSIGNESYGGKDLLDVANFLRSKDDRPVHYEGLFWDNRYPDTSDVNSQMYTSAADVEEFLKRNQDKPFILCEFAHAMGNSFGAVDRYMDLADREPLFQGGFIWDFADQAVVATDRYGEEFFGYGGDSGESPHDGDFCGNGIFFLDRSPTPAAQEVKYLYQAPKITITPPSADAQAAFTITNRWNFTNTDQFDCRVTLSREGEVVEELSVATATEPGGTSSYSIPLGSPKKGGEYSLDVSFHLKADTPWAKLGYEVAREQTVFDVAEPTGSLPGRAVSPLRVVNGEHNIGVHGEHFSAMFSKVAGGLVSYEQKTPRGLRPLLVAPPMPNFWHAPTSNEKGWGAPREDGQWLLASRYPSFTEARSNPSLQQNEDSATITFTYEFPTIPATFATVAYTVHPWGRVDVELALEPGEGLPPVPELSMLFTTDADLDRLTWYGEGPAESQVDRRGGAHLGIYEAPVAEQLTKYLRPQEAGNHTGVRWAQVVDEDGFGLRFVASGDRNPRGEKGMEFSALHWSPFEIENATHHHKLPPIHNTFIRPALMRRGVGGDDTWGARAHPEYLLPAGPLTFRFSFEGVGGESSHP